MIYMSYTRNGIGTWRHRVVLAAMATAISVCPMTPARGAAAQETVIEGGGAQTPPGGGRPDAQEPQLGTGNRGTGQRGSLGSSSVDPGKVRSEARGPGRIIGQVLTIDGDSYIIRDREGNELTFRVDRDTAIDGLINMGAKVAAEIEADGRVSRLQRLQ